MTKLFLEPSDNLIAALKKIKEASFSEVELILPPDSPLLDNSLNFKILKREAEKAGKRLRLRNKIFVKGADRETEKEKSAFGFVRGGDVAETSLRENSKSFSLSYFLGRLPILRFRPGFGLLVSLGATGFFLALLGAAYWYLPAATVSLTVDSESLVKSFELTASPSASSVDEKSRTIPAVKIAVTRQEKMEGKATGKKEVGEKAKGVVTLYNKTDADKFFSRGAVVSKGRVEGGDLNFLLDSDVTVPARTATVSAEVETYFSGRAEVAVTAEEIGEEYNLPKGTTFNVANYPTNDYIAQCYTDFSGGTKKTVAVVSQKDQKELESRLEDKLKEELVSDLESRLVGDQKLEKAAVAFEVKTRDFDKEVGEEVSRFNLSLEVSATGVVYSREQLKNLLGRLLEEFVPAHYELYSSEETVEIFGAKMAAGVLQFTAKVRGFVIPKIDKERLAAELAGRSLGWAREYLAAAPNVTNYRISLSPPQPQFLSSMPRRPERIKIEIITR